MPPTTLIINSYHQTNKTPRAKATTVQQSSSATLMKTERELNQPRPTGEACQLEQTLIAKKSITSRRPGTS